MISIISLLVNIDHTVSWVLKFCFFRLTGDPLYVIGGHPKCFGSENVEDNFAQDGYGFS